MPSAFGHACAALGIGKVFHSKKARFSFWIISVACSILPDIDAIGFKLGVPYDSMFGHRGFTHSIVFAAIAGIIAGNIFFRFNSGNVPKWKWILYFFLVTLSHPLLDACTNGGLGVAFFSPFSNTRYFFPFHPIKVSPIGIGSFLSKRGLEVLLSEFIWIGLPTIILIFMATIVRRIFKGHKAN